MIPVIRRQLRTWVDHCLKPLQLKLVNRHRTPRNCFESLARMKSAGLDIRHVIDVGAADGTWTKSCLKVYPDASYTLVEARKTEAKRLQQLNRLHPNVRFHVGAVGAETGHAVLYEHGKQTSLLPSEYAESHVTTTRPVEIETLDSIIGTEGLCGSTLLKLDVQGYEMEVFGGAAQILSNNHLQAILVEVSFRRIYDSSPLAHDLIHYLAERGFRMFDICSYCTRPRDFALAQSDVIFVRNDSPLFAYEGWQ